MGKIKLGTWTLFKVIVLYCFLASAFACMTIGGNQYIDMILSLIALAIVPKSFYKIVPSAVYAAFFLILGAMWTMHGGSFKGAVAQAFMILLPIQILLLKNKYSIDLLNSLSNWYAVLLVLSIMAWGLWLVGIPLPHTSTVLPWQYNDYGFRLENYFVFQKAIDLNPNIKVSDFDRFNGFFLEPGHIGTITSLFLFIGKYNFKDRRNKVFLLTIILSMSAAAFVLTALGYLLYNYDRKFSRIFYVLLLLGIFSIAVLTFNGGDNIVNELIFGKLTRESGAVDGRFSATTLHLWNDLVKSDDLFWGLGASAKVPQSAGYKVFIILNGILGAILVILGYWFVLQAKYSKLGLWLFVIMIVSFLQRVYCFWDAFLDPYILGIAYFRALSTNNYHHVGNIKTENTKPKRSFG